MCEGVDRKTDIMQMLVSVVLLLSLVGWFVCGIGTKTRQEEEICLNKLNDDKLFDSVLICYHEEMENVGSKFLV